VCPSWYLCFFRFPICERAITMRLPCIYLAGVVLASPLIVLAPGCGGPGLEATPEVKKVDPVMDLPGTKQMEEKFNKGAKAK
jgi:hypothetical protein